MEIAQQANRPQDPLAGKNYQVRRAILKFEVDVYNVEGALEQRGTTDELIIPEAEFPQALIEYFLSKGVLKDGFKTYKPKTAEPTP